MKIAVISLQPMMIRTVKVDGFNVGLNNQGQFLKTEVGGDGIAIASLLTDYGCSVVGTGFLGKENSGHVSGLLAKRGIGDYFVRTPGRSASKTIIEDKQREETATIEGKLALSWDKIHELYERVEKLSASCDWFVLAGPVPSDLPVITYALLTAQIKTKARSVAVLSSGFPLREAIFSGPTFVMLDLADLEAIVEHPLAEEQTIGSSAKGLLEYGTSLVVVSLQDNRFIYVDREQILLTELPEPPKGSRLANPALLAGLVTVQHEGGDLAEAARRGVALAAAVHETDGRLPPSWRSYQQHVSVRELVHEAIDGH